MSAVPLIFNEALNVSCHGRKSLLQVSCAWSYLWVFVLVRILRRGYGGEYFNGRIVLDAVCVCAACRMDPSLQYRDPLYPDHETQAWEHATALLALSASLSPVVGFLKRRKGKTLKSRTERIRRYHPCFCYLFEAVTEGAERNDFSPILV